MMLPKILGADVEVGNFVLGVEPGPMGTGPLASKALLREIEGFSGLRIVSHSEDWGRRYLAGNGGCAYIDLDHLELCLPETTNAYDFLACWQAMLRIASAAQQKASQRLPDGQSLHVLLNNSDAQSHSYGSHLNVLLSRHAWDRLFLERLDYLLFLASFQASSIVFAGQGKVGSENGAPPARYQLSQRADFIETIVGPQTTYRRPLVNSRDEPLCRSGARLHVIFYDSNLCHTATVLKVGVLQIVVAMIEAERVPSELLLEDPVTAVTRWSRDPELDARASTLSGRSLTAVEHQLLVLEEARRFVEEEDLEAIIPRADEIFALWEATLLQLEARDFTSLASKLDWVAKLAILDGVVAERPDIDWSSPQLKHLDQLYASLDPDDGLYWFAESAGRVEILVSEPEVQRFVTDPPDDTRAWTRAMLLRAAGRARVTDLNWDFIRIGHRDGSSSIVELPDPATFTRRETAALFARFDFDGLLDALDARREPAPLTWIYKGGWS